MTDADTLEIWLVLDLLKHAHPDDRARLLQKARELVGRLRREGKIAAQ